MVEYLIIKGKVIAWNDVDAGIFLHLPVCQSESLPFHEEFVL